MEGFARLFRLMYPGFPVEVRSVDALHAALVDESRMKCSGSGSPHRKYGYPGFWQMWDSTDADLKVCRLQMVQAPRLAAGMDRRIESGGIPHLAKNERDMGHPGFHYA
jgi:hypothetical protein